MRLFVAVFPPRHVRAHLQQRLAGLNIAGAGPRAAAVRRTPAHRWHITLAFLGEVPDGRLALAQDVLDPAVRRGGRLGPVRLRLAGGGSFGRGRSTVLWAGVSGDTAALSVLHRDIRAALGGAQLPCDHRPFTPHLTVAFPGDRLDPAAVVADREALDRYAGPEWVVDEVSLVGSRIGEGGGYDVLRAWPSC